MSSFSMEIYHIATEAELVHIRNRESSCCTVHHGCQRHAVKNSLLSHPNFGPVFFFGGSSDDIELSLKRIFQFHKSETRQNRQGSVEIMAAAVTDSGKSVILY